MDADAIARLAAGHGIPVYELATRNASLEEAYLELTGDSVDHRAATPGRHGKEA
jgi:ABC-2 type transport system ATP-binding protein